MSDTRYSAIQKDLSDDLNDIVLGRQPFTNLDQVTRKWLDNGGGQIQLHHKISQSHLAAMAGVARENVSRTMSDWRKRDIVTRLSDYYCINDPGALAQEMEFGS